MADETIEAQVKDLESTREGGKQVLWERARERIVGKIEVGEMGEVGDRWRDKAS